MKKLFLLKILVLTFIISSCSKNDDLSKIEIPQPKHPIIGKWKSKEIKAGPNFVIEFQDNDLLRIENRVCSECVDFYQYKMIDENSIEFEYAPNLAGEMMIMTVTVIQNNSLRTNCKNKNKPNENFIIDAPLMCMRDWRFQRIQ